MTTLKSSPGPAADSAFRSGMMAAALLGLAGIGTLHTIDVIPLHLAGYAIVLLFPMYLVGAASVLSVWLGYNADVTDLRPVYKDP